MSTPLETYEKDGYTVNVFADEDASTADPRDADNFCTLVFFGESRRLGDDHGYDHTEYPGWDELTAAVEANTPGGIVKPVYRFEHSGIALSTSDWKFRACDPQGWDWSQIGFAIVTAEDVRANYLRKRITKKLREQAEALVDAEVEEYSKFLNGEVYYFEVVDPEGNEVEIEDGVNFGFVGMDTVKQEADWFVEALAKRAA